MEDKYKQIIILIFTFSFDPELIAYAYAFMHIEQLPCLLSPFGRTEAKVSG